MYFEMMDDQWKEEKTCLWRDRSESRASSASPGKTILNLENNGHISKNSTLGIFQGKS